MTTYQLAQQGVYATVQGEGSLLGVPMTLIRLAGCSVGCPQCDTNYAPREEVPLVEVVNRVTACTPDGGWVSVTGGEPSDQSIDEMVDVLRRAGYQVALFTAGVRRITAPVHHLTVSPHSVDGWVQRWGTDLNLVPGLNGLRLADWEELAEEGRFEHRYVTPCAGLPETVAECVDFVRQHPAFRLGVQAHKSWKMA